MAGLLCAAALCGCGGSQARSTGQILRVPSSYPTIQKAVNASRAGETILIAPGIYHEAVTVTPSHPGITIRGADRNSVILDGERGGLVSGITVQADHVSVENLTIRRYAVNGLVFAPSASSGGSYSGGAPAVLTDWRGSYVTAYDNGLYGVYAFQARGGEFDHVYASGQPDSGIYVGQCRPCRASVTSSVATDNAVGYEDTNASHLTVSGLTLRTNRVGALLDSESKEKMAPQSAVTFEHNTVLDNRNPRAPTGDQAFGVGILISGGDDDLIEANRVFGQPLGIVVVNAPAESGSWQATDNRISANTISSRSLDLGLLTGATSQGNCFSANRIRHTFPANLERLTVCGRSVPLRGRPRSLPANPPQVNFLTVPAPPAQPNMP